MDWGKKNGYPVFEESENDISDDDLKALRELSRQIDPDQNPYSCIVSVLMLREGWDVRNMTTIYKLVSNINTFRNDYVAHQNKELTDSALARKALGEWASGLRQIWKLHG
jgi:hypothetical protein